MPGNGTYDYSQQQKDFLKAEFVYGLKLKNALEAGTITQDYYDSNIWLTTQQLQSPYEGFANEFVTAVNSEDLNWLANQLGEDVGQLTQELGNVVGKVAGSAVAGAASGLASGIGGGFSSNISIGGLMLLAVVGLVLFVVFRKELHI